MNMRSAIHALMGILWILAEIQAEPPLGDGHWSFQPLAEVDLSSLGAGCSGGSAIDGYVRARLEDRGLSSAKQAAAHRQIRRLCLTLTGLPPEPALVTAFVEDPTDDHYARLVDGYLQSPRFGERWARHWMDVVRYAETWGYEWNHLIREAYRYRDYLIGAFNEDLPYDEFIREHIAGDLLPEPRKNEVLGINESLIGGAFYRFGETGHDDCVLYPEISLDVMDNQIDTLTKSFQALTVSCARCHDHKLDGIPQRDYYALLGVMASSRQVIRTLDLPDLQRGVKEKLLELKGLIRGELSQIWMGDLQAISPDRLDEMVEGVDGKHIEHPLYAWHSHQQNRAWQDTATALRNEHQRRVAFNRENFEIFGDFTSRSRQNPGWGMEGLAVAEGLVPHGDFAVLPSGAEVIHGILPAGFYSHALSEKLNAALRSPWLPANKRFISYQSTGERGSVCRTVIANCTLPYFHTHRFNSPDLSWKKLGLEHLRTSPLVGLQTYLEWATVLDDQGYPLLDLPQVKYHETLTDSRSYFGLTKVLAHDVDRPPFEELEAQLLLFDTPVSSTDDLARRYREILTGAVGSWSQDRAAASDVYWINAFIKLKLLRRARDSSKRLDHLVAEFRLVEEKLQKPKRIVGMVDQGGFDLPLFAGGEVTHPKEIVPRGFVSFIERLLAADPVATGSGRRRMAELIVHPDNPLTARVMVNRIWHYLFGQGLVRSVDDFGKLSDEPSHPQLLDYLARRFMDSGWSMKSIVRQIVLSQTFRQSSAVTAEGRELDPENRLLHRYPSRRLEAEVIRDSMLWASGRLDLRMFGPSIDPYRESDVDSRKLYAGPLDGDGRRSLYLKVTRMGPPKMLQLFNFPDPSMTRGRRDMTNVPAQALGLRNHPFVHQQAEHHARRLVQLTGEEKALEPLLEGLALRLLSRPLAPDEMRDYAGLFHQLAKLHELDSTTALPSVLVWKDVIHALYNLKEFTYVL